MKGNVTVWKQRYEQSFTCHAFCTLPAKINWRNLRGVDGFEEFLTFLQKLGLVPEYPSRI